MPHLRLLSLTVALLWLGYGAYRYFFARYAAVEVSEVAGNPAQYENQRITVRGFAHMGFEAGSLLEERWAPIFDKKVKKTPLRDGSPFDSSIHLQFKGWLTNMLNFYPIRGMSCASGVFEFRRGHYGHFGISHFALKDAVFLKWPPVLAFVFFFIIHAIPSALILLLYRKKHRVAS